MQASMREGREGKSLPRGVKKDVQKPWGEVVSVAGLLGLGSLVAFAQIPWSQHLVLVIVLVIDQGTTYCVLFMWLSRI